LGNSLALNSKFYFFGDNGKMLRRQACSRCAIGSILDSLNGKRTVLFDNRKSVFHAKGAESSLVTHSSPHKNDFLNKNQEKHTTFSHIKTNNTTLK